MARIGEGDGTHAAKSNARQESQGVLPEPARTSDPAGWLMCFRQALRQALINF